jgi:hypothetical protein
MSFACPVGDQRLVLDHVVRMPELARSNRFAEASAEFARRVRERSEDD